MTKLRVYELTDKDLPDDLGLVKEVFSGERKRSESLHDYFKRKGIKNCFCKACIAKRKLEKNASLF